MVCGDAQPGGSPAQNLLDHPSGNRIRRATKSARQIGGALGNLVLPVGRIHGRNPVAVSRSWRRHALTACHGNDGAHSETASLVRRYRAGSCINKWTGRYASEVATTLQEDLACTFDLPWRPTGAVHRIASFGGAPVLPSRPSPRTALPSRFRGDGRLGNIGAPDRKSTRLNSSHDQI